MTAITFPARVVTTEHPGRFRRAVVDTLAVTGRSLKMYLRNPQLLVFSTIQPVIFVLMFRYVFGGAIQVPGLPYVDFLMPGIFAQTVVFGTTFTAVGVAEDVSKGIIDRLRSLPMFQPGVLIGRTLSDVVRNVFTFAVMVVVAFAVGWGIEGSIPEAFLGFAVLFAFGYALSWVQAWIGVSVSSVEVANSASFIWMFPMTFISSAFVDPSHLPGWLEAIANANPFSIVTDVVRDTYNGVSPGDDLWYAIAWIVGITAVFSFLAIRKYQSATAR